ncbi:MAG: PEGA domain-containing protein [Fidelibacterota bacterium]
MSKKSLYFACISLISGMLTAQETFRVANPDTTFEVQNDTTSALIIQEPVKTAVAVLELDANGVSDSEARALSDRLRIEIFNAGVYEVMEREKMNRILDEMEFQLNDCTTDECAIEVGHLIGVKKIIAGSISKVGEYYTVSARLIDVETSKIEATAIEDIEGTLGQVLTRAIPSVAQKISGRTGADLKTKPQTAVVNVSVDPPYSVIYIDGKYYGTSPLKIELEPDVEYLLRAEHEGYETLEKRITLLASQKLDVDITLSKIVEPPVEQEPKRQKRSISKGFRLKYISTGAPQEINTIIDNINMLHADQRLLFKERPTDGIELPNIKSFDGIEIYNSSSVDDNIGFEFGFGIYRGDLDNWFASLGEESDAEYNLVTWSPQLMLNLRIAPIRYPLFYPYFDVGFGYNLLLMNLYRDEESLGGPIYQSWGFIYGIGFEIRPIRFFGLSLEWNRKNADMQLMDMDKVTDRFQAASIDRNLERINLTGNRIGLALNFYY